MLPTEKFFFFKQCNSVRESFYLSYNNLLFSSVCVQSLKNRQKSAQSQSDWLCAPYYSIYQVETEWLQRRMIINSDTIMFMFNHVCRLLDEAGLYSISFMFKLVLAKRWASLSMYDIEKKTPRNRLDKTLEPQNKNSSDQSLSIVIEHISPL